MFSASTCSTRQIKLTLKIVSVHTDRVIASCQNQICLIFERADARRRVVVDRVVAR